MKKATRNYQTSHLKMLCAQLNILLKSKLFIWLVSAAFFFVFQGCEEEKKEIASDNPFVTVKVASNLADSVPYPERNPFTEEGISLGRKLFYDPILSANNQIACATCHMQGMAFTEGSSLSVRGVSDKELERHVPAIINIAWHKGLFWDGGVKNIESLSFAPLTHEDEMGQDMIELVEELQAIPDYRAHFKRAFGIDTIHTAYIVRALAQFQRTIISDNSKYDQFMRHEEGVTLNELELKGMQVFEVKCSSCHQGAFFTDFLFHNNGLNDTFPMEPEHKAQGRHRVTLKLEDLGKFKTPTLRNIMLTAPYMHDGRFKTIDEVLNHYDSGMLSSLSLDSLFTARKPKPGVSLDHAEKEAIKEFLHTLTDYSFISDTTLSTPF